MPAQARFGKVLRILVSHDLHAWISEEAMRRGLSVSAVGREIWRAAMNAAKQAGACRECPIHCKEAEA